MNVLVDPDIAARLRLVRRRFHRHPELSLQEYETGAYLTEELGRLNLDELRTGVGGTGILGTLNGTRPGPTTLLRADMDALPVTERNEAEYRSANAGVMHACGHDGHMSVLLEAARWFAPRRGELAGTLVFCFQPGEEGRDGNRRMILDGALENPHIDRTFALHLYSGLDVGLVGVRDGPFFASADMFTVEIRGKGGHGGMPEGAVDPVVGAAQLVGLLQTIVSREIPPKHPAVVTVGRISAGTASSVIPENAELVGTVRCLDADIRRSMPERIERIVRGLCQALRLEYSFSYEDACPPTVNDSAVNDVVRRVGRKIVGAENVVEHDVVMWAEDMAFMQEQRPGAYFLIGARGGESTAYPHHNAHFDLDERALDVAYRIMVAIGLEN